MTYAFIALGLLVGFALGVKTTHSFWRANYFMMRNEALTTRADLLAAQRQLARIPTGIASWYAPR